ncbi:MAG: 16S rRNA (guanine(527)-N(7))-methyltransferase RsmG [Thermodesulfobacteriota bacterium]
MSLNELLIQGACELGVDLKDEQVELFMKYLDNLKKWNKNINLTAIKDDEGVIINHFLDSISASSYIEDSKSLLDIGTGAGFPGLVLKIIHPTINATLLDSANKKVSFLNDTIRKLGLEDVRAMWGRAEDPDNDILRGDFDYVITRAVGSVLDTLALSSAYVSKNGVIILMRGKRGPYEWSSESDEIKDKFNLMELKEFNLPGTDIERILIILSPKE